MKHSILTRIRKVETQRRRLRTRICDRGGLFPGNVTGMSGEELRIYTDGLMDAARVITTLTEADPALRKLYELVERYDRQERGTHEQAS